MSLPDQNHQSDLLGTEMLEITEPLSKISKQFNEKIKDSEQTMVFTKNLASIQAEIMATEQMILIAQRRLTELKQAQKDALTLLEQAIESRKE